MRVGTQEERGAPYGEFPATPPGLARMAPVRAVAGLAAGVALVAALGACTTPPAPRDPAHLVGKPDDQPDVLRRHPYDDGRPRDAHPRLRRRRPLRGRVAALLSDHGLRALRPTLGGPTSRSSTSRRRSPTAAPRRPKLYHFRTSPAGALGAARRRRRRRGQPGQQPRRRLRRGRSRRPLAAQESSRSLSSARPGRRAGVRPGPFTVKGVRVALLASTQVDDWTVHAFPATDTSPGVAGNLDHTRLLAAVRSARASADVVVVVLHWGTDYTTAGRCPGTHRGRPARRRGRRRRRRPRAPGCRGTASPGGPSSATGWATSSG